jgi:Kef-type K+ transport system membrane component KefB
LPEILVGLVVVLFAAKLGGHLFERLSMPAVLGELLFGILIGNAVLVGIDLFEPLKESHVLKILAELGVILLLFQVGLESTVREMAKVGWVSFLVATLGAALPFLLGYFVSLWWFPEESIYKHLFLGATLTATSVGITARVIKDLGLLKSPESRIILGAAVIDDILGLIILATVSGMITVAGSGGNAGVDLMTVLIISAKAAAFLVGAVVLGGWILPRTYLAAATLRGNGVLLVTTLVICFLFAWLSHLAGLAPIVGAFAAGLVLEDVHLKPFVENEKTEADTSLEHLVEPVTQLLTPIFFVSMGLMVDLRALAQPGVIGFALLLTLVAVIGKQACSLGVWDKSINRLAIGLGMIPRGEVGLIFAGIGATLYLNGQPVIPPTTYSAVIVMVMLTTLMTPPLLRWAFLRARNKK